MFGLRKRDLTEGNAASNIFHLALPLLIALLLQDAFNIVDMLFVGRLGPSAIASVSISGIIIGFVIAFALGISIGSIAMVSRFIGAKRKEDAENVVFQSFLLSIILSIFIALVGWFGSGPLLHLLGATDEVKELGLVYMRIISVFSFTIFFSITLNSALRGAGDTVTPMRVMLLSTVLNIILDPIMIFGLFGFPRMGVAGSALATVISRGCGLPVLTIVFLRGYSYLHLRKRHIRVDFPLMWRIVKIGLFGSIESLIRNLAAIFLMSIVAGFGTNIVAGYGIVIRLSLPIVMFGVAFGNAAATLVGQNLGAGKPFRASRSAWLSAGFSEIIVACISLLFFVFSNEIITIFNDTPEVIRIGSEFLRFMSVGFLFMAVSFVLAKALQGAGDTMFPMVMSAFAFFLIRIPLAYLLVKYFDTMGIWLAFLISSVVHGLGTILWFNLGRWKLKII